MPGGKMGTMEKIFDPHCKEYPSSPSIEKKDMKYLFSLLTAVLFFTMAAPAQNSTRTGNVNVNEKALALGGYDPVSYFTEKKAVEGKPSIVAIEGGVKYQFSTEENKKLFLASPASYKPQYGGWCAYAMGSYGEKVEVDPETFKITDGKLYLFYNKFLNNTLDSWNKDEAQLKTNADKNWIKITKH